VPQALFEEADLLLAELLDLAFLDVRRPTYATSAHAALMDAQALLATGVQNSFDSPTIARAFETVAYAIQVVRYRSDTLALNEQACSYYLESLVANDDDLSPWASSYAYIDPAERTEHAERKWRLALAAYAFAAVATSRILLEGRIEIGAAGEGLYDFLTEVSLA
jgi:hypothetical protein